MLLTSIIVTITYVIHENINFQKWDKCIKKAINGSIYGYSWFLNIVSGHWDALIDENYENVMPLPYRKVLGFKILVQPHFATNLGVYSSQVPDADIVNRFLAAIPAQFRYLHINLNKYNRLTTGNIRVKHDIHYELDLIRPYPKIHSHYLKNVLQSLAGADIYKIAVVPDLNSNDLLQLYKKSKGRIRNLLFQKRINSLKMLVSTAVRYGIGHIYGAYTRDNDLCAAAFFVFSHQKATLLFVGLNKIAIKEHALEVIIDEFIKLHSEQNLTLRFEFVSRKKFAAVYQGFGGQRYQFLNIRQNRLPWFLKFVQL